MKAMHWIVLAALGAGAYLIPETLPPLAAVAQPQAAAQPTRSTTESGHLVVAEGRIAVYPGAEIVVASEKPGIVGEMNFRERDMIRKGKVIAELRNDDLHAALEEARAHVREAEADILLAGAENGRANDLVRRQFISRQALDRSERDLSAAQARKASAEAAVRRILAQIEKTRIVAPISGTVIARHVDIGEAVTDGGAVATLADLGRLRVEAEVDEFDVGHVSPGDRASITAEGFEGKSWRGKVEEIPDAVTQRMLRPQDIAQPTDARVLLVKIALLEPVPLKLGQRVEVRIAADAEPGGLHAAQIDRLVGR